MFEYRLLLVPVFRAVVRDRNDLVAETLLRRHQLAAVTPPTQRRPPPRPRDGRFWALVRSVRRDRRLQLVFVRPEAVVRWPRRAWKLSWHWRSRGRPGRPRLSAEVRELIAGLARE